MRAAFRLWWLLRSTCGRRRDLAVAGSFGLLTWAVLSACGLAGLALAAGVPSTALLAAIVVLVAALTLMAAWCARTLLNRGSDERLRVLRTTGASRAQATVIGALDVAEAALPGVLTGVLACGVVAWFLERSGTHLTPVAPMLVVPVMALALVLALVVARRVRAAD